MQPEELNTEQKAQTINLDKSRYGTFAEIGAGQEVARHFFVAGHASGTIAKTMSAYDMTFSDAIYGKADRYVSQPRLVKMLDHEYELVHERLGQSRSADTCFFAFADTVATSSHKQPSHCHGWMGLRFQTKAGGPTNDVLIHVRMRDRFRLQQQEALGILGVNLIFACFYNHKNGLDFIRSLTENVGNDRIEINFIKTSGPSLDHLDDRVLNIELVHQGLTSATLFSPSGEVIMASDSLYKKPLLVQRGTFRPVTNVNLDIIKNSLDQLKNSAEMKGHDPQVLLEISLGNIRDDDTLNHQDYLNRIDMISSVGHHVLVSNFFLHHRLKQYLREVTDNTIAIIVGASHLDKLFNESYYSDMGGGILEAFGKMFDENTRIYVYPYKSELLCTTATTFHPQPHLRPLYQYLLENKLIVDVLGCDDVDTSIQSEDVRNMLAQGKSEWEKLVPPSVKKLIKAKKLFGYQG